MGVVFLGFDRRGKAPDTFRDTYYIAHHHPLLFCYGHLGGIAILRAFSFLPGWDTDGVGFKDSEPKAFIHTTGRQLSFFGAWMALLYVSRWFSGSLSFFVVEVLDLDGIQFSARLSLHFFGYGRRKGGCIHIGTATI